MAGIMPLRGQQEAPRQRQRQRQQQQHRQQAKAQLRVAEVMWRCGTWRRLVMAQARDQDHLCYPPKSRPLLGGAGRDLQGQGMFQRLGRVQPGGWARVCCRTPSWSRCRGIWTTSQVCVHVRMCKCVRLCMGASANVRACACVRATDLAYGAYGSLLGSRALGMLLLRPL